MSKAYWEVEVRRMVKTFEEAVVVVETLPGEDQKAASSRLQRWIADDDEGVNNLEWHVKDGDVDEPCIMDAVLLEDFDGVPDIKV